MKAKLPFLTFKMEQFIFTFPRHQSFWPPGIFKSSYYPYLRRLNIPSLLTPPCSSCFSQMNRFLLRRTRTILQRLSFLSLGTAEENLMLVHGKTCLALGSSRSFLYVSVPSLATSPPVPPTDLWPPLKNNLLMTSRQTTLEDCSSEVADRPSWLLKCEGVYVASISELAFQLIRLM